MVEYFDINIEKKKLAATAHLVIPSGNVNTYALQLHISGKEWENLSPVVAFYSQEQKYIVMATNSSAVIPTSILKTRGSFSFGVFATQLDSNGNLLYRFSTNLLQGLVIEGAYSARDVCEDKPEDAALYEQLLFQNKAIDKAVKEHIKDETNPHKVTAEQVDAYNKKEADEIAAPMVEHMADKKNPHGVTAKQIGAYTIAETDEKIAGSVSPVQIAVNTLSESASAHYADKANPHGVTAEQVGAYKKAETDTKLAGKLDKVTGTVRIYPGVYATESTDGTPELITATSDLSYIGTDGGYIPLYAAGGQLKTAEPTEDDAAANKAYVDGKTASIGTHIADKVNPHGVTAAQVGAYTKAETDRKLAPLASKAYVDSKPTYETQVKWGGNNLVNAVGPIDAAMIPALGANRLAFLPAECVTIEYSRDNGATWVDYGATESQITGMLSGLTIATFYAGKPDTENPATENSKLRITLDIPQSQHLYTILNKLVLQVNTSSASNCAVRIERAKYADPDTFISMADSVAINGHPGYNVIPIGDKVFGGKTENRKLRLIFSNVSGTKLCVMNIYGFGGTCWIAPSELARAGMLYRYNPNQDAIFPAQVKTSAVPVAENDLVNKKYVDERSIQVKDGDIEWGGANRTNDYSPVDAAMISELGANRFAFIDQAQVSIEYSKDGGTTWTDYGAAVSLKTACFSGLRASNNNFVVGKCSTSNPSTANDKLRITVNQYSKLSCGFRKFALYTSSNGSVDNAVTVVGVRNDNVSVTLAENVPLKGWPGYNIVNLASNAILGTRATQYSKLIFTFTTGGQSASSPNNDGLTVTNIYGFGGAGAAVNWLFPSNMATNGHIYSWNAQQDTTFPARVKSPSVPVSYNDLTNKKYVDSKTAVLTNQYELIETITLTEATNIIERSTKPDGTAYSFAKVLITVDTPKTDTVAQQNIRLYINDGTLDYYAYYQSLTTYAKRAHFDCTVENGLLKIRIGNGATNYGGENTGVAAMIENANIVFLSAINKIKLKGEATFAVGTIIKIYGVRA